MKKKILIVICSIIVILSAYFGFNVEFDVEQTDNITETNEVENIVVEENVENEVIITEETRERVIQTKESIVSGDDLATSEEVEGSEEEEQSLEEEYTEIDGIVEQENISYDGDNTGSGLSLLGTFQGLTYYSQADSRWANVLYTSTGNSSQTIKSSGCGVTAGAMVVSSSKGAILPTTMAQLSVDNGYRTANNGTAWAYFSFIADYFGFDEFYTTYSFNTAMNYLETDADNDGNADYYIVVSCGSGLFTNGGHYIVLVADNNDTITVYDPYLYAGKFTTASRKSAGAVVSGNSVYVTETAFKTYANAKCYWVFSNDKGSGNTNTSTSTSISTTSVSYTRYVATQSSNLNVRDSANGTKITSLKKGTAVTVTEVNGDWSKISSPVNGWVSTAYLSSTKVTSSSTTVTTSYTTGKYKTTSNIHVRSGASTKYTAKTYLQLTANARSQNKNLGNYYYNGYKKGVVCTVTQVSGNWGKTASGWICLDYCQKVS